MHRGASKLHQEGVLARLKHHIRLYMCPVKIWKQGILTLNYFTYCNKVNLEVDNPGVPRNLSCVEFNLRLDRSTLTVLTEMSESGLWVTVAGSNNVLG